MKNFLIGVLVVAVIVLGYLAFKPKTEVTVSPTPTSPSGQTTTVNNPNGKDYQPSQQKPSSTTFTSNLDHFSVVLPTGVSLSEEDYPSAKFYRASGVTSSLLPYFSNIHVSNEACSPGVPVTINGIQYTRADDVGGGMESSSLQSVYCVVHAGKTYNIFFEWSYQRYTGTTPDRNTATTKFNSELNQLQMQFI